MKRIIALITTTALMMAMVAMSAMPASADHQTGLVNVDIGNVTVLVPVAVAANICPNVELVDANVASEEHETLNCEAGAAAEANKGQGQGQQ